MPRTLGYRATMSDSEQMMNKLMGAASSGADRARREAMPPDPEPKEPLSPTDEKAKAEAERKRILLQGWEEQGLLSPAAPAEGDSMGAIDFQIMQSDALIELLDPVRALMKKLTITG